MAGPTTRKKKFYPQYSKATKFERQFQKNIDDIAELQSRPLAVAVPGTGGGPAIENSYADVTAMFGAQGNQTSRALQFVTDASGDPSVGVGYAYYEYLGNTVGDITDYRKLSDEETLNINFETVPYAYFTHSLVVNLQIAQGSTEILPWNTENSVDTNYFSHDSITNNSRINILQDGRYNIKWSIFAASAGGNRLSWESKIRVNGTPRDVGREKNYSRGLNYGSGISATQDIELNLIAGDYVEASIFVQDAEQTSTVNSVPASGFLSIRKSDAIGGTKGDRGNDGSGAQDPTLKNTGLPTIDMSNTNGNWYIGTASLENIFSIVGSVNFGVARVRIDTTGKVAFPTVAGATLFDDVLFEADIEYDMWVENDSIGINYFFRKRI